MTLDERIAAALDRIKNGMGGMRVPADPTDPDLVLGDCIAEIKCLHEASVVAYELSCQQSGRIEELKEQLKAAQERIRELEQRINLGLKSATVALGGVSAMEAEYSKLEQQLKAAQERLARLVEFLGDAVAWIRILTDENPLTPTGEALLTKWDTALKEEYFSKHSKERG